MTLIAHLPLESFFRYLNFYDRYSFMEMAFDYFTQISTWFTPIFFLVFLIQMLVLKTTIQNAIYSGFVSIIVFLMLLRYKFKSKCCIKKQRVWNEKSEEEKECFECPIYNITIIQMIINTILSFLSSFILIYLVKNYYYNASWVFIFFASWVLGSAHRNLIFPKTSEYYSVSYSNFENSQTRCFSIVLLSIGLLFLVKYDIDYLCIQKILFYMLIFMVFDLAIMYGLIGLPRSTIHWFIEVVNRYIFGFSGSSTLIDCIFQLIRGSVSLAFCCVVLHYKNMFWSRMICLFFSSFVNSLEINAKIVILSLIRSLIGSILFIIFNCFLADKSSCNIIEIVFIVYYVIFEFIIPYISSISCYLFFYVQLMKNNKILNYVRLFVSLFSAPIILGSLLSNDVHFVISSLLIIHSVNRSFSEPHVFGLALIIARFALYYDLDLTSNIALNFLIGLFISRKFFSIVDTLFMRCKLSMEYFDNELSIIPIVLDELRIFILDELDLFYEKLVDFPFVRILIYYFKGILVLPSYCFYIPAFFWSLITGSPINFLYMFREFPQPYPPKSNIFWDFTSEKYSTKEHLIESFVYHSFVNSFKIKLFSLIKNGVFGIVDENSFLLFHHGKYIILCHIISINTFSIDFQIRCAEFKENTSCHSGELRTFIDFDYTVLSELNIEDSIEFIKSIYSPVATDVSLYGYDLNSIIKETAYISLSYEQKKQWITYSLCFCFLKQNGTENSLLNLVSEGGDTLINDIKNKLDIVVIPKSSQGNNNNCIEFHERKTFVDDDPFDEEIYNKFDFNSQIIHDFLLNSYYIIKAFMMVPGIFFIDYLSKVENASIESFLNNAGMRSCLYMLLASSFLTPDANEFEEVREFLDQTEEEYEICSSLDLEKNFKKFGYSNNDMDKKYENKSFFSFMKNKYSSKIMIIKKSESKWNVFKIERDFLRSIWASQCCEIFGFENLDEERKSLQKDIYHLHNLMNQISDVPMSYPAYVSNVEKSYIWT